MKRNRLIGGAAVLVLLVLVAWGFGWFREDGYSGDPAVAELQRIRDAEFAQRGQLDENQQQQAREKMRERMDGLTEAQRREFFESSAPIFMKMFSQQIDRFLALPPDEQRAEMDRRIDEMQARGGPPGGNFPPPDPQQVDQMRKRMLDMTTPEQRAKFETFMAKFSKRLEERGLSPGPGGGFF